MQNSRVDVEKSPEKRRDLAWKLVLPCDCCLGVRATKCAEVVNVLLRMLKMLGYTK